jgi:hypothetical protein
MDTDALIKVLAADRRRPAVSLSAMWLGAVGVSAAFAAVVVYGVLGPRADLAAAAETARFLLKPAAAITLAVGAFALVRALSRPGVSWRKAMPLIAAAPALLALAVIAELAVLPSSAWAASLLGANSLACLASITLIGTGPLIVFLAALRHGAPTMPAFAGAAAGLLAGAIAACFYAVHCTDDSPLFVATWYTTAILGLAAIGAAAARRFARW